MIVTPSQPAVIVEMNSDQSSRQSEDPIGVTQLKSDSLNNNNNNNSSENNNNNNNEEDVSPTKSDSNSLPNEESNAGSPDPNCNCFLCNQCPLSFDNLEALEAHLMNAHAEGDSLMMGESEYGDFNDDSDEGVLSPSSSIPATPPSVTPSGTKRYVCRFCQKDFETRSLLNIHYTHTHRDKPQYECDLCTQVFSVKRELATHRRTHSGESTHICTQCGKEFGTRQLLKKHWMWHVGERSHVCPHCKKAFFQKGHLTQHLMIHAGGRPHVCSLCAKTFIFKFDLNRHMKIHQERGYACDQCGRAFLKEADLKTHESECDGVRIADTSVEDMASATQGGDGLAVLKFEMPAKSSTSNGSAKKRRAPRSKANQQQAQQQPQDMPTPDGQSPSKMPNLMPQISTSSFPMTSSPTPTSSISSTPTSSSLFPPPSSIFGSSPMVSMPNGMMPLPSPNNNNNNSNDNNNTDANNNNNNSNNPSFCFLCMRPFPNQSAYMLHVTMVHFKGAVQQMMGNNSSNDGAASVTMPNELMAQLANGQNPMELMQALSSITGAMNGTSTTSAPSPNTLMSMMTSMASAAAGRHNNSNFNNNNNSNFNNNNSSFNNNNNNMKLKSELNNNNNNTENQHDQSFSSSPTAPADISGSGSDGIGHHGIGCDSCATTMARQRELEHSLAAREGQIQKFKEAIHHVRMISGSLADSCQDFDKLWILHSKKLHTQIQAILANLGDLPC